MVSGGNVQRASAAFARFGLGLQVTRAISESTTGALLELADGIGGVAEFARIGTRVVDNFTGALIELGQNIPFVGDNLLGLSRSTGIVAQLFAALLIPLYDLLPLLVFLGVNVDNIVPKTKNLGVQILNVVRSMLGLPPVLTNSNAGLAAYSTTTTTTTSTTSALTSRLNGLAASLGLTSNATNSAAGASTGLGSRLLSLIGTGAQWLGTVAGLASVGITWTKQLGAENAALISLEEQLLGTNAVGETWQALIDTLASGNIPAAITAYNQWQAASQAAKLELTDLGIETDNLIAELAQLAIEELKVTESTTGLTEVNGALVIKLAELARQGVDITGIVAELTGEINVNTEAMTNWANTGTANALKWGSTWVRQISRVYTEMQRLNEVVGDPSFLPLGASGEFRGGGGGGPVSITVNNPIGDAGVTKMVTQAVEQVVKNPNARRETFNGLLG